MNYYLLFKNNTENKLHHKALGTKLKNILQSEEVVPKYKYQTVDEEKMFLNVLNYSDLSTLLLHYKKKNKQNHRINDIES